MRARKSVAAPLASATEQPSQVLAKAAMSGTSEYVLGRSEHAPDHRLPYIVQGERREEQPQDRDEREHHAIKAFEVLLSGHGPHQAGAEVVDRAGAGDA